MKQPLLTAGELIRGMTSRTFIEERYRRDTPSSARLMSQAAAVLPGGNTRTTSFHPPYPVVIEHGDGPWLWDFDNRRYLDLFGNGLSLIHGNNYGPTREAMNSAMQRGTAWSGASREQIAYAELLVDRVKALELVRFTNSGSEAGMLPKRTLKYIDSAYNTNRMMSECAKLTAMNFG